MSITLDGDNLTTVGVINSAVAQNSTSGTSIDFTGIPAGVKRITVMFSGVSTNGSSLILVQLGAGSVTTSGYVSQSSYAGTGNGAGSSTSTAGCVLNGSGATAVRNGSITIMNQSSNSWISNHTLGDSVNGFAFIGGGSVTLGGALDRVRITTVNGTDTFDAGSINILYE